MQTTGGWFQTLGFSSDRFGCGKNKISQIKYVIGTLQPNLWSWQFELFQSYGSVTQWQTMYPALSQPPCPHSLPNREENLYEEGESILSFPDPLFIRLCLFLPLAVTKWKLAFSQSDNEQPVHWQAWVLRGDFQNHSNSAQSLLLSSSQKNPPVIQARERR